ncbi:hypothetical protein BV506_18435, partial [Klebsiella pneumoniae]|uniref:AlkA N-terminal domain-containing protein n=1 Tax=Klebsiella pneumoniae TaxID=573 RepID=UPI000CA3D730
MVLLPWTPPYDWAWMVGFLQARAVAGVERFHDGGYSRSFGVEGHRGLIHLAPDEEAQGLRVTLSPGLQPVAEICYARIGQLFDLACDPRQVARTLGDLLLVTLKAWQVSNAVKHLAGILPDTTPIVLIHNGMGTVEELR